MSQCVLPFKTCREKIKVKCLKIPKTKLTQYNPDEKKYWNGVIKEVEKLAKENSKETKIKKYDLSTSLPPCLYKKVSQIIPLIPIEEDDFELETRDFQIEEEKVKKKDSFHESEITEILEMEKVFEPVNLRLEPTVDRKVKQKKDTSWLSEFVCKKRKDRVKWNSRIYNLEKKFSEIPLYEQAEYLMDSAAERFTEWVNDLSNNEETNISKDLLKGLFSLETSAKHIYGIHIEPKHVKAVPNAVAQTWDLPEKSLELKLSQYLKERATKIKKHGHTVAFGRTLPHYLREWVPLDADTVVEPVFPKELLTRETIFKGIAHLRSTRALISFYKQHTNVPRPQYLVDKGHFRTAKKKVKTTEVPLYELLFTNYDN